MFEYIGLINFAFKLDIGPRHFFSLNPEPQDEAGLSSHLFLAWSSNEGKTWCPSSPSRSPKAGTAVNKSLSTISQNLSFITQNFIEVSFKGNSGIIKDPGGEETEVLRGRKNESMMDYIDTEEAER